MNRDELESRLRQLTRTHGRGGDCPSEDTLASYVDGGLSQAGHAAFERHLADCDRCMARVGLLGRVRDLEPERERGLELPDTTLARARNMPGGTPPRPALVRHAGRWAAAAVVVLAVTLLMIDAPTGPPAAERDGDRTVRNIEPLSAQPRLLTPTEGAVIDHRDLFFDWSPVSDSLYYQVRVVTDAGDLVWQQQLPGTQWQAPPELRLTPGQDYFVRIDAYLTESKSVSSDYVAFRTAGRR